MATWTRKDLEAQYKRAVRQGWVAYFREAARKHGFDVADLMAVASRETNMGGKELPGGRFQWLEHLGDNGHGCGLMQVDIGTDLAFKQSGKWRDAREGILRGTEVLAEKREWLKRNAGKKGLRVRFSSGKTAAYDGKAFTDQQLRRIAVAAYNCGQGAAYYHFSLGHSVDVGTTGKDYSLDTLNRAEVFRALLRDAPAAAPAVVKDATPAAAEEEREEETYQPAPEPEAEEAPEVKATAPAAEPKAEGKGGVEDVLDTINVPAETKQRYAKKAADKVLESGRNRLLLLAAKSIGAYELVDWLKLGGVVLVVLVLIFAVVVYHRQIWRELKKLIAWFQK